MGRRTLVLPVGLAVASGCGRQQIQLINNPCGSEVVESVAPTEQTSLGFSAEDVVEWFGTRTATVTWSQTSFTSDTEATAAELADLEVSVVLDFDDFVRRYEAGNQMHILVLTDQSDNDGCSPYTTWLDLQTIEGSVGVLGSSQPMLGGIDAVSLEDPAIVWLDANVVTDDPSVLGAHVAPVLPVGATVMSTSLWVGGWWAPDPPSLESELQVDYTADGVSGSIRITGTTTTTP